MIEKQLTQTKVEKRRKRAFQTPPPPLPPLSGEIEKGRGNGCVCALGKAAGEIKRTNREKEENRVFGGGG